jgi:hypothetical protein
MDGACSEQVGDLLRLLKRFRQREAPQARRAGTQEPRPLGRGSSTATKFSAEGAAQVCG